MTLATVVVAASRRPRAPERCAAGPVRTAIPCAGIGATRIRGGRDIAGGVRRGHAAQRHCRVVGTGANYRARAAASRHAAHGPGCAALRCATGPTGGCPRRTAAPCCGAPCCAASATRSCRTRVAALCRAAPGAGRATLCRHAGPAHGWPRTAGAASSAARCCAATPTRKCRGKAAAPCRAAPGTARAAGSTRRCRGTASLRERPWRMPKKKFASPLSQDRTV